MRTTSPGWQAQQRWVRRARRLILAGVLIVFALPLVWTGLAALGIDPNQLRTSVQTMPLTLDHFAEIGLAEPNFVRELMTSAFIAIGATGLALAVAFPAAYTLTRARLRGKPQLIHGLLILASLPVIAYVLPLSDLLRRWHLLDTVIGLLCAQAAALSPWLMYLLIGYITALPVAIDEAAALEGATALQVAVQIVLPALFPQVIAAAVIGVALCWNSFLLPLVLGGAQVKTIPVALSDFFTFERELEWPTAAAALISSLVPLVTLLALAHRALLQFKFRNV